MPSLVSYSMELTAAYAARSSAFAALIWWVVPVTGLLGGIGYVIWVSKFKRKFESETSRSVGQFQRFQESFREEPKQEPEQEPKQEPDNSGNRA